MNWEPQRQAQGGCRNNRGPVREKRRVNEPYAIALSKRALTSAQFTTFHQALR